MQVTCSCGKLLNVPDTLAGKNVRCPGCQKVFKVEGEAAPATPPGKIAFACSCGRKLTAPIMAAGKRVACPACNRDLVVPGTPPATSKLNAATAPVAAPSAKDKDEGSGLYALSKPHCPNCKAEMEANAQFCIQCGTNISTGSKVQQADAQQEKVSAAMSPKTKMIFIGVGALVLLLAALGVWLALGGKDESNQPQATPTTTLGQTGANQEAGVGEYVPFNVRHPTAVQIRIDDIVVRKSVEAFQAQTGRLPKSTEELEQAGYPLPMLLPGQEYDCNPGTGEITGWQVTAETR